MRVLQRSRLRKGKPDDTITGRKGEAGGFAVKIRGKGTFHMAVAGLVLGIIAMVSSIITGVSGGNGSAGGAIVFFIIALITGTIGFILSLVATIKKSTPRKGPAIAGLILSALVLVAVIIIYVVIIAAAASYTRIYY